MRYLVLHGWNVGLGKISLTKELRAEFGYSLAEAKSLTDLVLSGEKVRIGLKHQSVDEEDLLRRLGDLGAKASIEV